MLKKSEWTLVEAGQTVVILLLGIAIAGPAAAGSVYSWRTESGDVAYTDDIKNVPTRYREQVETRPTESLAQYARFSSQDLEGSASYAQSLQERLIHLQKLNESFEPRVAEYDEVVGTASFQFGGAEQVLTLTGDEYSDAPIIVERVRVMGAGQIATRHDTIVRQGNRTLSIFRGNQELETGVISNVVAEEGAQLYR